MPGAAQTLATSRRVKVALVLGGVICGLLIVEMALHLALPSLGFTFPTWNPTDAVFAERAGRPREDNGVRYTYDAVGFRTTNGAQAGQTVLFVGDSFTEGFGVEDGQSFPTQTCERLGERGLAARCLNAGVVGFGTAHELRLMRRLLDRDDVHAAAVVFQVLPSNDLVDNWKDGGFGVEGGKLVTWDPPHVPLSIRLRVAVFGNDFIRASDVVKVAANAWFQGDGLGDPPSVAAGFELEDHLLQATVATTQAHGVPIIILVCVPAWEVDPTRARREDEARIDFVNDTVQRLGVPRLDSRTVVRTQAGYIPNDGHFSVDGNALIGNALAEMLVPVLSRSPSADREAEREHSRVR